MKKKKNKKTNQGLVLVHHLPSVHKALRSSPTPHRKTKQIKSRFCESQGWFQLLEEQHPLTLPTKK
jgi:hypothetical protein